MARDYKHRSRKKETRRSFPGWLWGVAGILVGVGLSAAFRLSDGGIRLPQIPIPDIAAVPSSERAGDTDGEPVGEKPRKRFDFYDMLPRFEVVIPETESAVERSRSAQATDGPATYVLQAGSFRRYADADTMKARLALQGLESQIQKVTIDEREWHRVRLGPYEDFNELQRIRRRLRQDEIEVIALRISE